MMLQRSADRIWSARLGVTVRDSYDNPRYLLRAYETANAARLASILQDVATPSHSTVSRQDLIRAWAARYPRHADKSQSQSSTVNSRVGRALSLLKTAGIVTVEIDAVTVINWDNLRMSARNLDILQDHNGMAVPPSRWGLRRPEVPSELKDVQAPYESERHAATRAAHTRSA